MTGSKKEQGIVHRKADGVTAGQHADTLIPINEEYKEWIYSVSQRFKLRRISAAVKVNEEMLMFYWELGKDLSLKYSGAEYGSSFYKTVSRDLTALMPDVHSFSVTNLKNMKYFYELYPNAENRQQAVDDLAERIIFSIPWGHNILILTKCRGDVKRALFYVNKTLENNWSRAMLLNFLDTDLYERQGKAVSNFASALPAVQSDLAQEITRDPYNFDFLTLHERYSEKELKDALMDNITRFLLELGNGFSFVGREFRIEIGDSENFIDMLFYNIRLHCYVVIEVKVTEFEPSFTGQLGTYVVAVNHQLKSEFDSPTIGLLVCKTKDNVKAEYALEASSQPLGVSAYELSNLIPEEYKCSIPTVEEIERELEHSSSVQREP